MMNLRINPIVADDLKIIKSFIAEDNTDKALELEYGKRVAVVGAVAK